MIRSELRRGACVGIALVLCLLGPACGRSKITRSNYDKIKEGMTLQEVEAILGPGQEDASVSVNMPDIGVDVPGVPGVGVKGRVEVKGLSQSAKFMKWQDGNKVITIGILNGKVMSKAQAGL